MEQILKPQIEFLLMIQNFREITNGMFDDLFMFITSCGEITIPVILTAGIYWCINSKFGMYILWNWSMGTMACQFFKSFACIYRPWILDDRIKPIEEAFRMSGGYSFPSGHSQSAVSIWGSMAVVFNNKFFRIFAVILILLIAFSRVYIGVHTPQDVIASLFLGGALLYVIKKIMDWVDGGKNRDITLLSLVILSAIGLLLYEHFKIYPMDYIDGKLLVDPEHMKVYTFPKVGLYLGIFIGWFCSRRFLKFDGSIGSAKEKLIRYIIGAVILAFISSKMTGMFEGISAKKYAMFYSSFISAIFVTLIYPAIIIWYRKIFIKDKQ